MKKRRKIFKKSLQKKKRKQGKRIPVHESEKIIEIYNKCKRSWAKIMLDEEILALGYPQRKLENHIAGIKRRKNKKLGGNRATKHRAQIIKKTQQVIDAGQKVQDVPLHFDASSPHPLSKPALNAREQALHEGDQEDMSHTVGAGDVDNPGKYNAFVANAKDVRSIRNSKIHEKEEQKQNVVNISRQQLDEQVSSNQLRSMQNLVTLKLMQSLLDDGKGNKEKKEKKARKEKKKEEQEEREAKRIADIVMAVVEEKMNKWNQNKEQ